MLKKSERTGRSDRKTGEPASCLVRNMSENRRGVKSVKNRSDRSKIGKTIKTGLLARLVGSFLLLPKSHRKFRRRKKRRGKVHMNKQTENQKK